MAWSAPIQLAICLGILIDNLGASALAGFGLMVLVTPVQTRVMKRLFSIRKKSMVWTDKRAKLLQELLGGMKIIKFFAWETPFLERISQYRKNEIHHIRTLLLIRAANNAIAISLPSLAAVLSFVTYALSGHPLDPAKIFTALTLFQLLRLPLMFLPMSLSAIADAQNAINRISGVFEAELLSDTKAVDENLGVALRVERTSFSWDAPPPEEKKKAEKGQSKSARFSRMLKRGGDKGKANTNSGAATPASPGAPVPDGALTPQQEADDKANIFTLRDINMVIPRGQLIAIVGPVGTGKTSLLEGLIGEMRRTAGTVTFGGTVGYCPQSAWIQNATIRENICFGRPFEEERYWKAVKDSCLEPDLDMLPYGDLTEVGEKGISLSGGQKQRLNICE
jgi:ABC-type multidrug transport system fused ATPase/permease subunit